MTTQQTSPVHQLRLPGQQAAPEGPVDMTGMFLMHFAFRRDLGRFVTAAAHTPVDDRRTWRALEARWGRFARALHAHHTREDAHLWPQLTERARAAGDEDAVATLDAMGAEHAAIDPLLESVAAGMARLAAGADDDGRAALVVRTAAARDTLDRHMGHEERDALAVVQRYLSQADWDAMEQGEKDSPADLAFLVPWVLHGLPPEALPRTREFGGRALMLLGRLLRGRFERQERAAFRHG